MSLLDINNRRMVKILAGIAVLGCLLFFFGLPYGLGFLAGELLSIIIYEWNFHYWSRILDRGYAKRGTGFPHFLINYCMMAALMIFAVYNSSILNIFAAAAGLMAVKSAIIVDELFRRKGEA
jgi:O-antigen/teichoic acid export membrane protein